MEHIHTDGKRRNRRAEAQARQGRNDWIRSLLIEGNSQADIVRITNMSKATVSRALKSLKNQARESQREYIENEIPLRHGIILDRITALIQEAYRLKEESDSPEKHISLIAELTTLELSLLSDPVQIEGALKKIASLKKKLGNA
jgi:hypothetical protein